MRVDRQLVEARWLMEIGRRLREAYTDVAERPEPALERLIARFQQIEANETQSKSTIRRRHRG